MDTPQAPAAIPSPLPDAPDLGGLVTARGFHDLVTKGEAEGAIVAKDFPDVEIAKESGGGFHLTLTSGSKDRDDDVIEPAGLDWVPMRKNPIALWSHDARGVHPFPALIGVFPEIKQLKTRTDVLVKFVPPEVNPLGDAVRQMIEWRIETKALDDAGAAMSIGLLPLEFNFDKTLGGIRFVRSEPLEGSFVSIGSNRDALRRMKSAGVNLDPVAEWAEHWRKIAGPDQENAMLIIRSLDPATSGGALFEVERIGRSDELRAVDDVVRDANAAAIATALPTKNPTGLYTVEVSDVSDEGCSTKTTISGPDLDKIEKAAHRLTHLQAPKKSEEAPELPSSGPTVEQFEDKVREATERKYIALTGMTLPELKESR